MSKVGRMRWSESERERNFSDKTCLIYDVTGPQGIFTVKSVVSASLTEPAVTQNRHPKYVFRFATPGQVIPSLFFLKIILSNKIYFYQLCNVPVNL